MAASTTSPSQPMITPSKCDDDGDGDDRSDDRMKRKLAVVGSKGEMREGKTERGRDRGRRGRRAV